MSVRFLPREVVIAGAARTPIGSFLGSLSSLSAVQLASVAITGALSRSRLDPSEVDQVIGGQVLTGGEGQAPARQAAIHAGIPPSVDVFSVNKVCSSGLKAVCLAAQSIAIGHCETAVAFGMESMSRAPYLLTKAREGGYRFGDGALVDSLTHDGLTDAYNAVHMGMCAEKTAEELQLSRVDQDNYAIESYRRAAEAWKSRLMSREVVPVQLPKKRGQTTPDVVEEDEEYTKLKLDKVAGLKPAFKPDGGTVTAANASKLNDGAAALVLMSAERAAQLHLTDTTRILSFADAAVDPMNFPIAPASAVTKALDKAGVSKASIDYYEINEAFSAVALANMKLLQLDPSCVNVHGGAVALGHPLGMSGARILMSLINVLESRGAVRGCASICNGGGGATAIVIERDAPIRSKV